MAAGFSYKGNPDAPDVASSGQSMANPGPSSYNTQTATGMTNLENAGLSFRPDPVEKEFKTIEKAVREEMALNAETGMVQNPRDLMKSITQKMTQNGEIRSISDQKWRKIDRMFDKMDKKIQKQGPDIDMKNITGLEWFFMIMAAAGLVLGIIGFSPGWLVLLVFGGLFLYFKLVKDK